MSRSLILTTLALALSARAATAQPEAPSTTRGFFLGASLVGATLDTDADDEFEAFAGGGLGLELGYGFSSGLALFLNLEAGGLDHEQEAAGESFLDRRVQADLGLRMNIGGGRRRLVPFVEAGVSGLAVESEDDLGEDVTYSGGGLTVGGGVQYFLRPAVSLNAGLRATTGAFTEVEAAGGSEEMEDQFFSTSRVFVGATWHP